MNTKIILPEMGEGVIEGTVARWLKKEGEAVEKYDPLLEIETDKVTTEAEAESAGVLLQILVAEGETVPVGTVLGIIAAPGEKAQEAAATANGEKAAAPSPAIPAPRPPTTESRPPTPADSWISPVVARMAAEHDIDLTRIEGTGLKRRITKNDVLAYLEEREQPTADSQQLSADSSQPAAVSPQPSPVPSAPSPPPTPVPQPAAGELLPLTNMRRAIAEHMVRSKATSPHVTTVFEVDFSAVVAHRKAHKAAFAAKGAKLTFTPYILLAIARGLQAHPLANSSWEEDGIRLHREINIGMATALDSGLIVPVIKGADGYNLLGMARAVNDLAERARSNKLKPDEVRGGTFSLTNHGVSGSLFATPIINQPQCGILGVGAIQKRVVVVTDQLGNDAMAIRPLAYLSFTFDHRILDGVTADNFVAEVKQTLETWA